MSRVEFLWHDHECYVKRDDCRNAVQKTEPDVDDASGSNR